MVFDNDFDEIKERFGSLLSYLSFDGHLQDAAIDELVFRSPFFDFLEDNDADRLLRKSNNEIYQILFGIQPSFLPQREMDSQTFWAGEAYILLAIKTQTPLKQIFLQMPLEKMREHFTPYHEMSDESFIENYRATEKKIAIFPLLCIHQRIGFSDLVYLSGISRATLVSFSRDNHRLFNAHHNTITTLIGFLKVSTSFFREESSFVPFDPVLLKDPLFQQFLSDNLLALLLLRGERKTEILDAKKLAILPVKTPSKTAIIVLPYELNDEEEEKIRESFDSYLVFAEPVSRYCHKKQGYWQTRYLTENRNDLALEKACRDYLKIPQK